MLRRRCARALADGDDERWQLPALIADAAHRRPGNVELQRVAAPDPLARGDGDADDALGAVTLALGLQSGHRNLAGVVEALGPLGELDVLADLAHRLQNALHRDVVNAGAEHERHRTPTDVEQLVQLFGVEVTRERSARWLPVRRGAVAVPH